ncbi:sensor histidine kinase [Gracilibacillus marinus]|uniref:histidine kinase n=1 Tax=Gracilibacillus marinus TaxID=630535 RepID=A0ABV8VP91_9BACI
MELVINLAMVFLFSYVYFALFIAFYIGNLRRKAAFVTFYVIHLTTTVLAIIGVFLIDYGTIIGQLPFLIMTILGIILIPINRYNRLKQDELEGKLEDANRKIARLAIIEERHRIARDLHDTLGQKLSMIGLKSELAKKLISKEPTSVEIELDDIQKIARQALKEVREMVSNMKSIRILDELAHVKQLLHAGNIKMRIDLPHQIDHIPLFIQTVLSMCLKESVTNIVKHSEAKNCYIKLIETEDSFFLEVKDDGIGIPANLSFGNGLYGMQERLEFVNGKMEFVPDKKGMKLFIVIPNVIKQGEENE